jgi:hypothetical protein
MFLGPTQIMFDSINIGQFASSTHDGCPDGSLQVRGIIIMTIMIVFPMDDGRRKDDAHLLELSLFC